MFKPTPPALAAVTIFCGLAAAAFTTDRAGVHAQSYESPIEFSVRQQRGRQEQYRGEYYAREPRRVYRPGGFFGGLFGFEMLEQPAPRKHAAPSSDLKRAVCRRRCDGAQIVLGFVSSRGQEEDARQMCAVAAGGAPTEFSLEKFVPGAGFAPPEIASAPARLLEGRASLAGKLQPAAMREGCTAADEPMMVPILHDATLRNGDVVATRNGFKVFVGKGEPPFGEKDFVALDSRRKIGKELRDLKIADR